MTAHLAPTHLTQTHLALRRPKSLFEHAACFGLAALALTAAALGLQWLLHLIA